MKIITSALLMVTIIGSSAQAQQFSFYSERASILNIGKRSRNPLTQIKIKTPCKRNRLAFRLKGVFKFKREYATPYDYKSTKCFTVNIHPYRIHLNPKTKSL